MLRNLVFLGLWRALEHFTGNKKGAAVETGGSVENITSVTDVPTPALVLLLGTCLQLLEPAGRD